MVGVGVGVTVGLELAVELGVRFVRAVAVASRAAVAGVAGADDESFVATGVEATAVASFPAEEIPRIEKATTTAAIPPRSRTRNGTARARRTDAEFRPGRTTGRAAAAVGNETDPGICAPHAAQ
jgi:hypothetical protein